MASDVVYFLPSEKARLVLGYLHNEGYMTTYKCFLKECPHLSEYLAMKKKGQSVPLTINGISLLEMLEEYAAFKLTDTKGRHSIGLSALWTQLDSVIRTLKDQTTLTQGRIEGTSQSARIRRETVQKKRDKEEERRKKKYSLCNTSHTNNLILSLSSNTENQGKDDDNIHSSVRTPASCTHGSVRSPAISVQHLEKDIERESCTESLSDYNDRMECTETANVPDKAGTPITKNSSSCHLDLPPLDEPKRSETYTEKEKSIESVQTNASVPADKVEDDKKKDKSDSVTVSSQNCATANLGENDGHKTCTSVNDKTGNLLTSEPQGTPEKIESNANIDINSIHKDTNPSNQSSSDSRHNSLERSSSCKQLFKENKSVNNEPASEKSDMIIDDEKDSKCSKSSLGEVPERVTNSQNNKNVESSSSLYTGSPVVLLSQQSRELVDDIDVNRKQNKLRHPSTVSDSMLSDIQAAEDIDKSGGNVDTSLSKTPRRKRPPRKKYNCDKRERKNLTGLQNESSNSTDESSVMDSSIPSFLEQILNNTLLHEKLAENINKTLLNKEPHRSKHSSGHRRSNKKHYRSHPDQRAVVEEKQPASKCSDKGDYQTSVTKSPSKTSENVKKHTSNSLNTDLNDILDLHETQMSEGQVTGIIEMTKSDPVFETLFNLFAPYSAEVEDSTSKMTDFSGIKLEMGKDAIVTGSLPSFSESLDCPDPSNTTSEENLIMEILQSPEVRSVLTTSDTYTPLSPMPTKSSTNDIPVSSCSSGQPIVTGVTSAKLPVQPITDSSSANPVTMQPLVNNQTLQTETSRTLSCGSGHVIAKSDSTIECAASDLVTPTVPSVCSPHRMTTRSKNGQASSFQLVSCYSEEVNSESVNTKSGKEIVKDHNHVEPVKETFETSVTQSHGFPVLSIKSVYKSTDDKSSSETSLHNTANHSSFVDISCSDISLGTSKSVSVLSSTPMCAKSQENCRSQKAITYNSFLHGVNSEQNSSTPVVERTSSLTDSSNCGKENVIDEMMNFVSTLEKKLYGTTTSTDDNVPKGKKKKGRKKKDISSRSQWSKDLTALMKIASPEKGSPKPNKGATPKNSNKKKKGEKSTPNKVLPNNGVECIPVGSTVLLQSGTVENISDTKIPVIVAEEGYSSVQKQGDTNNTAVCLSMPSLQCFMTNAANNLSTQAVTKNSMGTLGEQTVMSQGDNMDTATSSDNPQVLYSNSGNISSTVVTQTTGLVISSDEITEAVSALKSRSPCSSENTVTPKKYNDLSTQDYSQIPYSENCDFLESPEASQNCDNLDVCPQSYSNVATPPLQVLARTAAVKTPLTTLSPVSMENTSIQSNIGVTHVGIVQPSPIYIVNEVNNIPVTGKYSNGDYVTLQQAGPNISTVISQSTTGVTELQPIGVQAVQTHVEQTSKYLSPDIASTATSSTISLDSSSLSSNLGGGKMPFTKTASNNTARNHLKMERLKKEKPYIAIPIGRYVPQKMLHVKTLDFGPEVQNKVIQLGVKSPVIRQPGYGRGKKKQTSKVTPKAKSKAKNQNKVLRKDSALDSDKDEDDFIPDASGSVYLGQGTVIKTPVPSPAQFQDTDCSESCKEDVDKIPESETFSSPQPVLKRRNFLDVKSKGGGGDRKNDTKEETFFQKQSPGLPVQSYLACQQNYEVESRVSHTEAIATNGNHEPESRCRPMLDTNISSKINYDDLSDDSSDIDVVGDFDNPFKVSDQQEFVPQSISSVKDNEMPEIAFSTRSAKAKVRRNLDASMSSTVMSPQLGNSPVSFLETCESSKAQSRISVESNQNDQQESRSVENHCSDRTSDCGTSKSMSEISIQKTSFVTSKMVDLSTPPKKRITAALKSGEQYYYVSSTSQDNIGGRLNSQKQDCQDRSPQTSTNKITPKKKDRQGGRSDLMDSPSRNTRSRTTIHITASPKSDHMTAKSPRGRLKRPREESVEITGERKSKKVKHKKKTVDLAKLDVDKFLNKIYRD